MASLCLRLSTILVAFLHFNVGSTSEETPRKNQDQQDKWWHHFVTRPDIQAPKYQVEIHDRDAISDGYWFVAPYANIHNRNQGMKWEAGYIYDWKGDLIWASSPQLDYYNLYDFKVATYNGEQVITAISPLVNGGLFLNSQYKLIRTASWTSNWTFANMHEFNVIENGTRALATTRNRWTQLSLEESQTVGFDGNCVVRADGVKEIDLTVDPPKVLFEWIGIEHIPLKHSVMHKSKKKVKEECTDFIKNSGVHYPGWDIHHLNAVDKFADGDYLVSSRELGTIFKISHIDGSVVWRMGGKHSDFEIAEDAFFKGQHTPRILEESDRHLKLSIFANQGPVDSRGIVVLADKHAKTVELLQVAHHPLGKHLASRGSNQVLPNGNLFICWANHMRISEHDPSGKLLFFAHVKRSEDYEDATYRGYKFQWVGSPKAPPDVVSSAFQHGIDRDRERTITTVFVSWNGATEVDKWYFYESDSDGGNLKRIGDHKKHRFETHFQYDGFAEYVVVEAVDKNGETIGHSKVVTTIPPVEQPSEGNQTVVLSFPDKEPDLDDADVDDVEDEENDDDVGDEINHIYDGDFDREDVDDGSVEIEDMGGQSLNELELGQSWILEVIADSFSAYLAGFATCAAMWLGIRIVEKWRKRTSSRKQGPKYEPLKDKDEALLYGVDEDDATEDDIELRDRM